MGKLLLTRYKIAIALLGGIVVTTAVMVGMGIAQAEPKLTSYKLTATPMNSSSDYAYLTCEPAAGTHPQADKACAAIIAAEGNFENLSAESGICTREYMPVKVTAQGTWRGKPYKYSKEFGNSCELKQATGAVFDF